MAKSSYVLRALRILGPEEMLKLSEVLHVKQKLHKKAAGGELIVWDDAPEVAQKKTQNLKTEEAKVLPFNRKPVAEESKSDDAEATAKKEDDVETPHIDTEIVLFQREITKHTGETVLKMDAFKGYRKSTEVYSVKTTTPEGKEKVRFAETNGVLVNKKQA